MRRAPLAALILVLPALAAGCAAGTVAGDGAAIVRTPATSSTVPDVAAPSSTTTSSVPASPSSSVTTPASSATGEPPGEGVVIANDAGHYRARFPSLPQRATKDFAFAGYRITVHVDTATWPYLAIVQGEVIDPALAPKYFDQVLRSAVNGLQASTGLTLLRESATRFQGHTARVAVFRWGSVRYELLAFVYSGSQVYALLAPEGARFDALAASFQPK